MALDKWIAVFFLIICLIYGFTAFDYVLLPFERNMAFLPNTLPKTLSVLGAILSSLILLAPKAPNNENDANTNIDLSNFRQYNIGQTLGLVVAMLLYAIVLRPIGFVAATTLFLIGSGFILGERKLHIMLPVALSVAIFIWYLVQEILGIFLKPLPWFIP